MDARRSRRGFVGGLQRWKPQHSRKKYVQERLWDDRNKVRLLFELGSKVYVCGKRAVADGIFEVMVRMRKEWSDDSSKQATQWFQSLKGERFMTAIFDWAIRARVSGALELLMSLLTYGGSLAIRTQHTIEYKFTRLFALTRSQCVGNIGIKFSTTAHS